MYVTFWTQNSHSELSVEDVNLILVSETQILVTHFCMKLTKMKTSFCFIQLSLDLEHSGQILPQTSGASRGSGCTGPPLPPLPGGSVFFGGGCQPCAAIGLQLHSGGGEKSWRSCFDRIAVTTVESTRPQHPAPSSHYPW